MGKTLLGIDLEESPAGGLVERLLSDEELEALADGGREPDEDDGSGADAPDASDEDESADDAYTGSTTDTTFVEGSDAGESDGTVASGDDDSTGGDSTGGDEETETPSPGGFRDRVPSVRGDGEDEDEEGGGGIGARVKSVLPKLLVALVVLAVLAFVLKKYGGKLAGVVSDKLGRGGDSEEPEAGDEDVPEARQRAKADSDAEREFTVGLGSDEDAAEDEDAADADEEPAAGSRGGNTDTAALVGLAFLALVAALVRKFTEEREYDPLVDGPDRE
jgi:hypothetical protein